MITKRQKILDAALLLSQQGLGGHIYRQIAKTAGVAKTYCFITLRTNLYWLMNCFVNWKIELFSTLGQHTEIAEQNRYQTFGVWMTGLSEFSKPRRQRSSSQCAFWPLNSWSHCVADVRITRWHRTERTRSWWVNDCWSGSLVRHFIHSVLVVPTGWSSKTSYRKSNQLSTSMIALICAGELSGGQNL